MKGILLAGGTGSRLYPLTHAVNKHLLPIYNKPMIYYPLSILMLAGIREIVIITTAQDQAQYKQLLKDGQHLGLQFHYAIQEKPRGIADAFNVAAPYIDDEPVALILGDNIFYGAYLQPQLQQAAKHVAGCTIIGCPVRDPSQYGVVELNEEGTPLSIEEKPLFPKSSIAIPGLYFFDQHVTEIAAACTPSIRGELEITSVLNVYLQKGKLRVLQAGRGLAWLDTGTIDALHQASHFVQAIQQQQGYNIACIEEIAYRLGYISAQELIQLAKPLLKTDYGTYLMDVAKQQLGTEILQSI